MTYFIFFLNSLIIVNSFGQRTSPLVPLEINISATPHWCDDLGLKCSSLDSMNILYPHAFLPKELAIYVQKSECATERERSKPGNFSANYAACDDEVNKQYKTKNRDFLNRYSLAELKDYERTLIKESKSEQERKQHEARLLNLESQTVTKSEEKSQIEQKP